MLNVLYKYLILHKTVGITGVGNFSIQQHSTSFNGSTFQPSPTQINFDAGTSLADRKFYQFVANEKGISEVDAIRQFQDFGYLLKKSLQNHPFVELKGLGSLKRNSFGEIEFKQTTATNYFPVISPSQLTKELTETVLSEKKEPEEVVSEEEMIVARDRWWIWATVLAVLAIAAIAYVYWQDSM